MYYPIKFKPIYKEVIWGGQYFKKLGKDIPSDKTGESWEIASHSAGTSVVDNGFLKGKTLKELVENNPTEILGNDIKSDIFPLLIKFIDANSNLSVQVHPDDDYAYINENKELGKSEMWYVIDAKPGSKLVFDLKSNITKEDFEKAVKNDDIESTLNFVEVEAGDCFNIPSGLVHAIGAGIVVCEVQQNSNTTYRVYDYKREDANGNRRDLHVEKALDVIDFSHSMLYEKLPKLSIKKENFTRTFIVACKYFSVEHIKVAGKIIEDTNEERFYTYTILKGNAKINDIEMKTGESVFIPAKLGSYTIEGTFEAIKSYVPNIEKDVIDPLVEAGYSIKEINDKVL